MNLSKLTDENLAVYIQENSGVGFEEVMDRYEMKLLRYSFGIVKDESQAQDIVQETFIAVYRNINSFDAEKKFSSWIYRIAHNKAINELRKKNLFSGLDIIMNTPDEKLDAGIIEEELDKKKTRKIVLAAVESLPIRYREVMLLRYFEDRSYEEISDILRLPKNTVGVRITRGLGILKRKLNIKIEDYL